MGVIEQEHGVINVRLTHLEKRQALIEQGLEKIKNRPPVWATVLLMSLTGIIGYLAA